MGLFAFMVASDPRCSNEVNQKLNSKNSFKEYHPIERVIFYAAALFGGSNAIGAIAGALAGAFYSSRDIPRYLIEMCESYNDILMFAQTIYEVSLNNDKVSSEVQQNDDVKINICSSIS
jgi:hypothetical protein